MADYYSLLARAVGNLPKTASPAVRKAVYDRARSALLNQLRSMKPPLPEADIEREKAALDAAVARIEAETAAAAPTAPPSAPPAPAQPPDPPKAPETPRAPITPRPTPSAPTPSATRPMAPSAVRPPAPATPPVKPSAPPPPPPPPPPPLTARPPVESVTQAPPLGGVRNDDEFDESDAPATMRVSGEGSRPAAPGFDAESEPPPKRTALWLAIGAVGGFVTMIAVAAFFLRQSAHDFVKAPTPAPSVEASSAPSAGKAAQRAEATPEPTAAQATPAQPTPAPSPAPTEAAATPAPAPAPSPAATQASPVTATTSAPSPEAAATPAAPVDAVPVGARSAIVIAVSSDPAVKPVLHMGTVVWSQAPAAGGQLPILKAVADLPDLKGHAEVTIKKNLDAALPASHLIDVKFTFDDGSEIKAVTQMDKPLMHQDDGQRLDPMSGAAVKVGDNHFLIGLAKGDADLAHNLDLISTHSWFDFPIILLDGKYAKLTIEKGADGEALIAQTLAAWK